MKFIVLPWYFSIAGDCHSYRLTHRPGYLQRSSGGMHPPKCASLRPPRQNQCVRFPEDVQRYQHSFGRPAGMSAMCTQGGVFFFVCLPQDNWKPFNIFLYSFILPSNFFLLLFFFSFIQQMRVRSLSGTTYYLRSGASISGKIHERFMLIDGNRVATGSYR